MLDLILGEMLEQVRFFEQGLGRAYRPSRTPERGAGDRGKVLATRWIE